MSITTRRLTRAAATAAVLGGAIYIAIQFIHPLDEIESLSTQLWVNVHILSFAEALIAPLVAVDAPQLAVDFVGLFGRYPAVTDLGLLAAIPTVGAVLYVGGALALGIAVIRARVLSRGAAILLIAAAAVAPVAGALLPHTLERMAAVPMGAALIWLGASLWMGLRKPIIGSADGDASLIAPAATR